jgi:hypothetical protein
MSNEKSTENGQKQNKNGNVYRYSIPLLHASSVSHTMPTHPATVRFSSVIHYPPSPTPKKRHPTTDRSAELHCCIQSSIIFQQLPRSEHVFTIHKPLLLPSDSRQCPQKIQQMQRLPDIAMSAIHMNSPLPADQNKGL